MVVANKSYEQLLRFVNEGTLGEPRRARKIIIAVGSANLTLYLGEKFVLGRSINDFLKDGRIEDNLHNSAPLVAAEPEELMAREIAKISARAGIA